MKEMLLNLAISLFLTKDNLKLIVRKINSALAEKIKLEGKEVYAGWAADAMGDLAIRAEAYGNDGKVDEAELERLNAFDCSIVEKYWDACTARLPEILAIDETAPKTAVKSIKDDVKAKVKGKTSKIKGKVKGQA